MYELYKFEHISGLQGHKMPTFDSGNLAENTKSRIDRLLHTFFFLILPTSNGWTEFTVHVNRTKFSNQQQKEQKT